MSGEQNILRMSLEDIMGDRFGRYSKYIIQDRALPDARDGLKPVQRRILYAMFKDGNTHDKPFRKSAKTVGNVIGNYHPHGDSSVYDAMVRMSQDWKVRNLLIEMHGNNGSIDGDPAAAMRYTEARLSPISSELLRDIDAETVDFAPNFDDSLMEPTVLPSRYPNLLVNGATGISAGYATDIPPHNLAEIIDATIKRIDNPKCTIDDLLNIVKGPDFPTGGIVQGLDGIRTAYETGKGKVIIRSKIEVEEARGGKKQFVITEIPYEINKALLVRRMDEIRIDKKIEGIAEVRDESDREGLRIVVELKKEANEDIILNYLLKNTDLQRSYNFNMVAIANKRPVLMGLINLLDAYINHQVDVIKRRTKYELRKSKERLHIVEGLIKALSILDEVIETIRNSKDKKDAKDNLKSKYEFTEIQAEAIVMLQLYRLTNTDVTLLIKESDELVKRIYELEAILNSDTKLRNVIKDELKDIKKQYPTTRLSEIQEEIEQIVIDETSLIPREDVIVTVSKDGYVKRVSMRSYTASNNEETGLKEEDYLIGFYEMNTINKLLLFTNKGNYLYVPVHEITEARWKDLGKHISNIIPIEPDEYLVASIPVANFNTRKLITTITKHGYVKRSELKEFEVTRYSKTYTAMKLKDDDELINAFITDDTKELLYITQKGYALRYNESEISIQGIKASGVKAINLSADDLVINGYVYANEKNESVVIVNNRGKVKRVKYSFIGLSSRAKKGELLMRQVKSKPHVVVGVHKVIDQDILNIKTSADIVALEINTLGSGEKDIIDKNSKDAIVEKTYLKKSLEKVEIFHEMKDNNSVDKKTKDSLDIQKSNKDDAQPKTTVLSIDDFLGEL